MARGEVVTPFLYAFVTFVIFPGYYRLQKETKNLRPHESPEGGLIEGCASIPTQSGFSGGSW